MITRRMQLRRRIRSASTSALSEEERRMELREAEARSACDRGEDAAPEVSPSSGGEAKPAEAHAGRAGVDKPH
jgi:hypothetical protein